MKFYTLLNISYDDTNKSGLILAWTNSIDLRNIDKYTLLNTAEEKL